MSTKQNNVKLTKGKQKIEIKKVETYGNRMITFSKRKSGIYKKMNELITKCDIDASILIFSESGKPYSLAHPSMEAVSDRLMNTSSIDEPFVKDNNSSTEPLVEAYKKRRINDLMKKYADLVEESEANDEKLKTLMRSCKETDFNKMWWNTPIGGDMSTKDLLQRQEAFAELHEGLCDLARVKFGKGKDGSSSGGFGPCDGHGEA